MKKKEAAYLPNDVEAAKCFSSSITLQDYIEKNNNPKFLDNIEAGILKKEITFTPKLDKVEILNAGENFNNYESSGILLVTIWNNALLFFYKREVLKLVDIGDLLVAKWNKHQVKKKKPL